MLRKQKQKDRGSDEPKPMRITIERIGFYGFLGGSYCEIAFEEHAIWLAKGNRQIRRFLIPNDTEKAHLMRDGDEVTLWIVDHKIYGLRNHSMGEEEFFKPYQVDHNAWMEWMAQQKAEKTG